MLGSCRQNSARSCLQSCRRSLARSYPANQSYRRSSVQSYPANQNYQDHCSVRVLRSCPAMQRHPGLLHRKAGQWCQTEEQPELVQERLEPGQLEHCTHFHSHQALAQHPSQRLQALVQRPFRLVREEQQVHRRPHELQEQYPFHWWSLVGGVVVATALRSLWSSRCCGSGSSRCAAAFSTTSVRRNRCSRGRTSTTVKDQITQQSCAA